jgi:predicted transcriptional regulator
VAEELLTSSRTDLLQALAVQAHRSRSLVLEESMREAWQQAFDRYGRRM